MREVEPIFNEAALDRLRELASIGAAHAATAFARLMGRTVRMEVPRMRTRGEPGSALDCDSGVFFEVEGGLGGVIALLFPPGARAALLRRLLGAGSAANDRELQASALREFGNILASHVVSAIADTLGTRILPSIPVLALESVGSALASLLAHRGREGEALRFECEIFDGEGELRGLVVLVPDSASDTVRA